jgi:hypothetical protein
MFSRCQIVLGKKEPFSKSCLQMWSIIKQAHIRLAFREKCRLFKTLNDKDSELLDFSIPNSNIDIDDVQNFPEITLAEVSFFDHDHGVLLLSHCFCDPLLFIQSSVPTWFFCRVAGLGRHLNANISRQEFGFYSTFLVLNAVRQKWLGNCRLLHCHLKGKWSRSHHPGIVLFIIYSLEG